MLRAVLKLLNDDQESVFLQEMKERIPRMINNKDEFTGVFYSISPRQHAAFFDMIKGILPNLLKDSKNFSTILYCVPLDWKTRICNQNRELLRQQFFTKDFNYYKELMQKFIMGSFNYHIATRCYFNYYFYLSDRQTKKIIQHAILQSLLEIIDLKSSKLLLRGEEKLSQAAKELSITLKSAITDYFEQGTCSHEEFQTTCNSAIAQACKELQHHRGWKDIFAKLLLTVVSGGIIPLGLSIRSKCKTDSWQFRLFKTDSEKKLDDIAKVVASQHCNLA